MPGELPLVLLALVADGALGGYELLRELERRFSPTYRPSPGSVYPALTALRSEGLVQPVSGKGKAKYRLTNAGKRMLTEQQDALRRIEHRTNTTLDTDSAVQALLARLTARVNHLSSRVDPAELERVLDNALNTIAPLEINNGQ